MNPYNFTLLFFAFCSFFTGLIVLLKRRDQVGKSYFIFIFWVACWSIAWSILLSGNISYSVALFCSRAAHASGVIVGVTWYHLTLLLSKRKDEKKNLLMLFYVFSIGIDMFAFTPAFIPQVISRLEFNYYTVAGPLLDAANVLYAIQVIFGFIELWKAIKKSDSAHEKIQYKGLFISTIVGFIGGTSTLLPIYGVMLPQYNLFLMPIYPFMMAYFMMRHGLFDIEQVIQAFQREKLATIGLLAASVNHEIRNPLYVAKTTLESYIEKQEDGDKAKESLDASKKSLSAVNRALDVITKLNRFAKPSEETKDSRQKTQANIHEALKNVLDLVSYEFQLDKIKIINNIPKDLPPIQADQRQLEEILFNLIVNACHALKEKKEGELTISASLCHSEAKGHGHPEHHKPLSFPHAFSGNLDPRLKHSGMTNKVQITIQDAGSGIPKEHLKHLFEPFHTTKGENGTGLGLYITKQLVERNGGKISVKSQDGKGTSFVLEFRI